MIGEEAAEGSIACCRPPALVVFLDQAACWLLLLSVDDGLGRRRGAGPIIVRTAPRRAYDSSRL